jgi:uncharacterized protein YecE (DUF72 family)
VLVGCCGQAGLALARYAEVFPVIELQSTFYRLPREETARRWRESVPSGFRFTLKAFQGVTHPASSPTWRRAGSQRPTKGLENYGHLKPTEENFTAWRRSLAVARALRAEFIVLQLPPSFTRSPESLKDMEAFLTTVERPLPVGVEVRHKSWKEKPEELARLLDRLDVVHVVDPFRWRPLTKGLTYFRLHGLGSRPYHYTYTQEDLERLSGFVGEAGEPCYVLFNNLAMREDAQRFMALLKSW